MTGGHMADGDEPGWREREVARTSNGNNDPLLIKALRELLDHYVGLVNSGDAGNWDPEKEGEVAQARAALRLANVAPYMNSPIECGHRLARLVCPDCGIDLRGNVVTSNETRAFPQAPDTDERYNVSDGLLETLIEVAQDNGFRDVVEALRELQVRRGRHSQKASERQPCSHGNVTGHCQHCLDAL